MKVFLAYIGSPICYYLGHICSMLTGSENAPFDSSLLAFLYQKFMQWSCWLEDWCGKDIVWTRDD